MYSYGGGYSYTSSYVAPKRETPEENLANYRASYPDAKDGLLDAPLAEKRANLDFQSGAAKADQREDFHISDFHAPDGKFCRDWDKVRVVCERWRLRSKRFLCVACTTPQLPATLALTPTRTHSSVPLSPSPFVAARVDALLHPVALPALRKESVQRQRTRASARGNCGHRG